MSPGLGPHPALWSDNFPTIRSIMFYEGIFFFCTAIKLSFSSQSSANSPLVISYNAFGILSKILCRSFIHQFMSVYFLLAMCLMSAHIRTKFLIYFWHQIQDLSHVLFCNYTLLFQSTLISYQTSSLDEIFSWPAFSITYCKLWDWMG